MCEGLLLSLETEWTGMSGNFFLPVSFWCLLVEMRLQMEDDDLLPLTYVHISYSGCTAAVLLRGDKLAIWALNLIIAPLQYTSTEAVCKISVFYCVELI